MAKNKLPQGETILTTKNGVAKLTIVKNEDGDYVMFSHLGNELLGGIVVMTPRAFADVIGITFN